MAIYNNREVYIVGPTVMSTTPERLTVRYIDGSQENVPTNDIKFTQDEKTNLIKVYPSKFDNVIIVTEDDVKSVRLGVAPSYDPDYKVAAETKARAKVQQEESKKITDKAEKDAEVKIKELNAPVKTVTK
jgi:hypothetical protein